MTDIRIDVAASRDFEDSFVWYAERSESAAFGFEAEFERMLQSIQKGSWQISIARQNPPLLFHAAVSVSNNFYGNRN